MIRWLPWILLILIVFMLFLTNHWPFAKKEEGSTHIITTSTIVTEIENMGKVELVKYNFKEILDYNHLSKAKVEGSVILKVV